VARAETLAAMSGFGWNFYAFFGAAAVWVTAYNVWAWWLDRPGRDKRR